MQALADAVIELLADGCERIEVTGELRRRRPVVTKIELLVAPRYSTGKIDLWGGRHGSEPQFDAHFENSVGVHPGIKLEYRLDERFRRTWSEDYKRAWVNDTPLELYMVKDIRRWGLAQVLQTGPYAFVEIVRSGLPGILEDRSIAMAEERDVFAALGIPYVDPHLRRG
jgi:hypothetical protein